MYRKVYKIGTLKWNWHYVSSFNYSQYGIKLKGKLLLHLYCFQFEKNYKKISLRVFCRQLLKIIIFKAILLNIILLEIMLLLWSAVRDTSFSRHNWGLFKGSLNTIEYCDGSRGFRGALKWAPHDAERRYMSVYIYLYIKI